MVQLNRETVVTVAMEKKTIDSINQFAYRITEPSPVKNQSPHLIVKTNKTHYHLFKSPQNTETGPLKTWSTGLSITRCWKRAPDVRQFVG